MKLLYTKSHTELIRQNVIDNYVLPIVKRAFAKYPQINSATFAVAQYWDYGVSKIHDFFLYSVLDIPDWEAFAQSEKEGIEDSINLPGFEEERERFLFWSIIEKELSKEEQKHCNWDNTRELIPAFAAFCKEGSHQDMDYSEAYTPYAILRRTDNRIVVEIVGKMLRPWLDGIRPERSW